MSQTVTIYGIANCDTIKKAKKWLTDHNVEFTFHDYRKQGLDPALLQSWVDELGWEVLINKRGTTWRQLSEDVKNAIDSKSAVTIMLENPAIIKRPMLIKDDKRQVGFSDAIYSKLIE